jgi:hypothetical protein
MKGDHSIRRGIVMDKESFGRVTGSREPSPSSSTAGLGPSGFDPARECNILNKTRDVCPRHGHSHEPLACYDCGLPYAGDHWVEAVVPHHIWNNHLSPSQSGGILCINCMAKRASERGLKDVPIKLTAGPFKATANE